MADDRDQFVLGAVRGASLADVAQSDNGARVPPVLEHRRALVLDRKARPVFAQALVLTDCAENHELDVRVHRLADEILFAGAK